jgi:hypothetical protein
MTPEPRRSLLNKIQSYASSYFEIIYKTHFAFWQLPDVPAGGNILTGGFATALIFLARRQFGQSTDPELMSKILAVTLFVLLLICGILVVFDPHQTEGQRLPNGKRLISVTCVGITLGCGFVFLDAIVPWIAPIQAWAAARTLSQGAQQYMIATAAALLSCVVIYANTLFWVGVQGTLTSARVCIWTVIIFVLIALGLNLIIAPPF